MDWTAALSALGLVTIAVLAGGAAVGIASLVAAPAAIATLSLVAVLTVAAAMAAARTRPRLSTSYWD